MPRHYCDHCHTELEPAAAQAIQRQALHRPKRHGWNSTEVHWSWCAPCHQRLLAAETAARRLLDGE